MHTPCNALVVPARLAHPVHVKAVELDVAALQRVANGDIGIIAGVDWHVYLDSEGNRVAAPNLRAEVLIREAGIKVEETLRGAALFLGRGSDGEEADAPRHLIRLAEQLFDLPLAA
ncbi:hypothetical protein [Arthrobacter sp. FW306-07-I]|uniref:hypothetical protein n=1 Tax=Arthrobacter sp. FW306-07-I TaxID=2879622 RepID=UPI001F2B33E1|nr:hypothetical protein [Arthrobacter sp. FW306-07-I]UKA77121.1 hypothetical protein LFT46_08875 [Arthrobacter sp. FW306-07-I]